jgi:predicted nucleotidyltransferase
MDCGQFMTDKTLNKIILEFVNSLKISGVNVAKVILFGSYAQKNNKRYSDIDVCVVSKDFGKNETNEMALLISKARQVDQRIEPIPYTPKQLNDFNDPLAYEIKKFGKVIELTN